MKPVRPTPLQEIIRQWILLIPLATAVVGSASIFAGPEDEWIDYLPPIFFVGALLVTAAMLHQRRMFYLNLALTERLQSTNHRLDILHRLALELNKSLDVVQVAQTVIDYSLRSLNAEAGAIWLRIGLLPAGTFEPGLLRSLPVKSATPASRRNWVCIASNGSICRPIVKFSNRGTPCSSAANIRATSSFFMSPPTMAVSRLPIPNCGTAF